MCPDPEKEDPFDLLNDLANYTPRGLRLEELGYRFYTISFPTFKLYLSWVYNNPYWEGWEVKRSDFSPMAALRANTIEEVIDRFRSVWGQPHEQICSTH